MLRYHSFGKTDIGRKRKLNEDAYLIDDRLGLYIVADGMGGHASGDVASQEAIDAVYGLVRREHASLQAVIDGERSEEALSQAIRVIEGAVQAATYMIFGIAQYDPEQQGMGTTISLLAVCDDVAITGQVGDSRVYRVRDEATTPLTEDHTLVAWQMKQGLITKEQAVTSPHRNVITRAVGSREYVEVDTAVVDVKAGDAFLLCSDGLHSYVNETEISQIMNLGPESAAKRFIDIANERGGRDNITAIVVQVAN